MIRAYLAAPMRGVPHFNAPALDANAERLRANGIGVYNPAEQDRKRYGPAVHNSPTGEVADFPDFDLRATFAAGLNWLVTKADVVVVLPGGKHSKGVLAEVAAAAAVGIPVYELDDYVKELS